MTEARIPTVPAKLDALAWKPRLFPSFAEQGTRRMDARGNRMTLGEDLLRRRTRRHATACFIAKWSPKPQRSQFFRIVAHAQRSKGTCSNG